MNQLVPFAGATRCPMADPKIIDSPLLRVVEEDGVASRFAYTVLKILSGPLRSSHKTESRLYGMTSSHLTKSHWPKRSRQSTKRESEVFP